MPNNRNPDVRVLELRDDFIRFELLNTDISMANSLRRIMIAEVPTLCIDKVEIMVNTTNMPDEFLAHRLGLIPLRSTKPMKDYTYMHLCECEEGCDRCTVRVDCKFTFDELRAKRMDDSADASLEPTLYLTSDDLEVKKLDASGENDDVNVVSFCSDDDQNSHKFDRGIAITRIGMGQELHFVAYAYKGIAKEHAKWSPVATVALKHDPIVKLNEEILDQYTEEQRKELVDCCPKDVFEHDETTNAVKIRKAADCIFCRECLYTLEDFRRAPEDLLGVEVLHSASKFTFTVETTGALEAKVVVKDALERLKEKLTSVVTLLTAQSDDL